MEIVAATLYGLDILILIAFQVMNRDSPQFSRAVSDYGLGKTARLFRIYILAGSIAAPLLAWQFWRAEAPAYPAAIPVYLVFVMLGRVGIGLFPNDLRGGAPSRQGKLHRAATMLAFTCAYMTVIEATPLLSGAVTGPLSLAVSGLKQLISLGFIAVVLTISAPLRPYFGIAERVFLYATAVWFLTASLTLPPL